MELQNLTVIELSAQETIEIDGGQVKDKSKFMRGLMSVASGIMLMIEAW